MTPSRRVRSRGRWCSLGLAGMLLLAASPAAALTAAVLPSGRSVQVGATATVFATMVNTTFSPVAGCRIALASAISATLTYQTTDPSTNTLTGTPNTPAAIGGHAAQSFAISLTPTAPISPTEVEFAFVCDNEPAAPTAPGVNTLLFSASTAPVADVVATVFPPPSFLPGVVSVDQNTHDAAFGVTAINLGAAASITVSADTGAAGLPLTIVLCQTSIATAGCVTPAAPSVTVAMDSGGGLGLAVFVHANGAVPFNLVANRISIRFTDAGGAIRGSTSIAVEAQISGPGGPSLRASLDGAQEVPPTSSAAGGSVFFSYDELTRELRFSIFLAGLEGTEIAAQIHGPAMAGENAPMLFALPLGSSSGRLILTPAQGVDLLAGRLYVNVLTTAFPDGEIRGQILRVRLAAAVLPGSRSVAVGTLATAFATISNQGPEDATGCRIALATAIPAAFSYQTTNPATNTVTGAPSTPVDIAAFAAQSFVISIAPTAPIPPIEVAFRFECANGPPALVIVGVNTLLLSASTTPTADVIAIALAPTAGTIPGILLIESTSHQAAFALATVNVGAPATITVTGDTGGVALPVTIALCRTTPSGACQDPPAASITLAMGTGNGAAFAVFVTASGPVRLNAAVNRLFLRARDAGGATRGSTSIAIFAP